jgi:hypothetical protein
MQLLTDRLFTDSTTHRQYWYIGQLTDNDNSPTVLGLKTTHRQGNLPTAINLQINGQLTDHKLTDRLAKACIDRQIGGWVRMSFKDWQMLSERKVSNVVTTRLAVSKFAVGELSKYVYISAVDELSCR